MTPQEIILAHKEHLFPSIFHFFAEPLLLTHAKNQYVWDAEGKQYLDFLCGIVTVSVGHANDHVNARLKEQIDKLQHVSTLFVNEPQARLASKLAAISPGGQLTKSFFTNSGSEANEAAILTARCYTGSTEIIALRHGYHGRGSLGMALNGQQQWHQTMPPQPGIVHAHNAYCYRCPFGLKYPDCEVRCATDMKDLIETSTSGRVAGFIAEPIQGIGGFITPPKEYFKITADIVRQHGGLFIADEVQTAWGRTGTWFGIEHWGVVPDIITSAKGLGNGFPVAVTMAKPAVADGLKGLTISTFGGGPIATTAASAVIEFIEQNMLMENAVTQGDYLRQQLLALQERHPIIGDVRGMGLMQAVELVTDRKTKEPAKLATARILEACREEGLLLGKGGLHGNVFRITPPLNIERADIDEFVVKFGRALHRETAS